ncbi:MAG: PhoU domain-containing protein [bacterium]
MFRNLFQIWKGKDFFHHVIDEFGVMLDDTEDMFNSVCRKLLFNEEVPNLKEKIYSIDKQVNNLERDIRKRVVEHLSIQPSADVPLSLLLMSVVKDAERLGDYAKNLLEVGQLLDKPIDYDKYSKRFNYLEKEIADLFKRTKKAFIESDENLATSSWKVEREIVKKCDEIIKNLAKSDLSTNQAVCYTLIARHFKRIAAHLTNIATSVILPISDLDYFDEKR